MALSQCFITFNTTLYTSIDITSNLSLAGLLSMAWTAIEVFIIHITCGLLGVLVVSFRFMFLK